MADRPEPSDDLIKQQAEEIARLRAELERGVRRDYADQLDTEQLQDLNKRLESAEVNDAFGPAYTVVLGIHGVDVDVVSLPDSSRRPGRRARALSDSVLTKGSGRADRL